MCFKLFHSGFDDQLARHFAYLFIRDPISLFEEKLQQDPNTEMDHFEVKINIYINYKSVCVCYVLISNRTFSPQTG